MRFSSGTRAVEITAGNGLRSLLTAQAEIGAAAEQVRVGMLRRASASNSSSDPGARKNLVAVPVVGAGGGRVGAEPSSKRPAAALPAGSSAARRQASTIGR